MEKKIRQIIDEEEIKIIFMFCIYIVSKNDYKMYEKYSKKWMIRLSSIFFSYNII